MTRRRTGRPTPNRPLTSVQQAGAFFGTVPQAPAHCGRTIIHATTTTKHQRGRLVTIDATVDYFTDPRIIEDPFPYYEAVRANGPVWQEPHHGAFVVTGYEEISEVARRP